MTSLFGRYVSMEMAILCLVEASLSFCIISLTLARSDDASDVDLAMLLACSIGAVAVAIGLYRPALCREPRKVLVNAALAGVLAFPVGIVVSETLSVPMTPPYLWWLAKVLLVWVACGLAMRWAFGYATRQGWFARRIVVLGSGERAQRLRSMLRNERTQMFQVMDDCVGLGSAETADPALSAVPRPGQHPKNTGRPDPGMPDRLRRSGVWGIVLAEGAADWPDGLLDCKLRGIRVFDDIGFVEDHLGRLAIGQLPAERLLIGSGFATSRAADAVKRVGDVLGSMLILVATLPLMLVTGLAVRLDSPGPIFYRQQRIGLHGKPFTLFKFRSMRADAEAGGSPRWAAKRDPRVTRVGGLMRSTRIDELPQLLNVLRGEMSLVGPRPERPHFVEQLVQVIPYYRERSYVKPGITGWAQVNFPYGASVEDAWEKHSFDLYYIKNRTLFLDLLILVATVRVILFREGAR